MLLKGIFNWDIYMFTDIIIILLWAFMHYNPF